jgi:hypothetical protein
LVVLVLWVDVLAVVEVSTMPYAWLLAAAAIEPNCDP